MKKSLNKLFIFSFATALVAILSYSHSFGQALNKSTPGDPATWNKNRGYISGDKGFAFSIGDTFLVSGQDNTLPWAVYQISSGKFFYQNPVTHIWAQLGTGGGGSGTVTSVALAVPSGFSVSGSPITSSGTITISAPGSATTQYMNGAGGASLVSNLPISTATQGALDDKEDLSNKATNLTSPNNTKYPTTQAVANAISGLGTGTVTNVTGTAPINVATGTTTPAISIDNAAADGTTKGAASFNASDFNSGSGNISLDYTNGQAANVSTKGYLTASDWGLFNGKESALTFSAPLTRSVNAISIPAATSGQNGYLSSTDWSTFNNKQGVITLTTTGTSGAASLVGNTLNIPQYTGGGGGGTYTALAPLTISGSNVISNRYHPGNYGTLYGDDIHDDRDVIQSAINAAYAGGGGDVVLPSGVFRLSGALVTSENGVNPNSQLYVPPAYVDKARTHVRIIGETRPNWTPASLYVDSTWTRKGTILHSVIDGSGTNPSVIGGTGSGFPFTFNYLSVENVTILVKANGSTTGPTMSGINGLQIASLQVENCIVGIDTSLFKDTMPSADVAGILTAKVTGETFSSVSNSLVYGMKYGIVAGEHCYLSNSQVQGCFAGYVILQNSLPVFGTKIESQWCKYDVLVPNSTLMGVAAGASGVDIKLLEVELYNTNSRWFNNSLTINDSGNRCTGYIGHHVSFSGGASGGVAFGQYAGGATPNIRAYTLATNVSSNKLILSTTQLVSTSFIMGKGDGTGVSYHNIGVNDAYLLHSSLSNTGNVAITNDNINGDVNIAPNAATAATVKFSHSTARTGLDLLGLTTSGNATNYIHNNRGFGVDYMGFGVGNSAYGSSFFGTNAADYALLFADGLSSKGILSGTVTNMPWIMGTNNIERVRITGGGLMGIGLIPTTDKLEVAGNLSLTTAGNKLKIATGTNASMGTATLSSGTVTVSTTAVTASSKIFLTDATTGGLTNVGTPTVGTITAGTSFVINSTNVLDASTVNWLIIN